MTAEILRRAARQLRDTAASCEQGDWTAEVGETGHAWISLPAYDHAWGMHGFAEEARHVALMHPPVALTLAACMDAVARIGELDADLLNRIGHPELIGVARAILREPS